MCSNHEKYYYYFCKDKILSAMLEKKFSPMKILKIGIALSTFLIFPLNVRADFDLLDSSPSYDSLNTNNSINSSLDKYRTSENNWGSIGQESEIDLSEWGGRVPSCAEAPGCPICTD